MFIVNGFDHLYHSFQVLYATPSQDGFYDITDALEEQGMEQIIKVKFMSKFRAEPTVYAPHPPPTLNTALLENLCFSCK